MHTYPTRSETPEVWIVDVHLDGSEEGIPAIVDLGCQVGGWVGGCVGWLACEWTPKFSPPDRG